MDESEFQLVRGLGFVAAAALAVGLQRLAPHARVHGDWRVNLGFWLTNLVVVGAVCGACACTTARWAAGHGLGILNVVAVSWWLAIATTILALDLVSYVWHRANHVVPLLWRLHRVHHSDARFTASTAVRFHPGELVLSLPLRLAAVIAIGAPPEAVVAFEVLFATANFVEHGDIDLPAGLERRLQWCMVTPALHRRHHGRAAGQLGSNFGTVLTLWDRAFGTYRHASSRSRIRTGLAEIRAGLTLAEALALPLRAVGAVPGRSAPGRVSRDSRA